MRVADLDVRPDRVMLDTNVLLAATDEGRAEHHDALTTLNDWAAADTTLCTSGQILREYLAVATLPADQNGLGLKPADAVSNVRAIRERTVFLAEDAWVADRLQGLLGRRGMQRQAGPRRERGRHHAGARRRHGCHDESG